MITIQIINTDLPKVNKDLIKKAVKKTLSKFNKTDIDVTIRITDDPEIAQLNQEFRGISSATDVLSFNQDFLNPETGRWYLGDIIISLETAVNQAPKYNLTPNQECAFLAIHGTLHLLGYNHDSPEDKEIMWEIQDNIFSDLIRDNEKKADKR
jgi:probable rRNA maturation factor